MSDRATPAAAFPREVELLRATVRHAASGAPREPLGPLCRQVNWTHVLWLGRQLRALLFLEEALRRAEPGLCPPEVRAQLATLRAANQLRALMRARELCRLHDLFKRHDLPVIAASGAVLAQHYYDQPVLREVSPESLYFAHRAERARADAALVEAGYNENLNWLSLSDYERSHVVFHSRLGVGRTADTAPWAEAEHFSLGEREILTLSPVHWLIQLSWEGGQLRWPDFRAVYDVAMVRQRMSESDWDAAIAHAASLGREPALLMGLDFCHRLLGLPLPAAVEKRCARRTSLRRHVDALERPFVAGHQQPIRFFALLRGRLALQPNLAHKVRATWRLTRLLPPFPRKVPRTLEEERGSIGLFAPTPPDVVTAMLRLAETGPADVVCDAGCGDGRVVIAAARQFGARGLGLDLDPRRIAEAQAAAEAQGVADRVRWHCGDFLRTNVSEATVVCLYLQGLAYPQIRRKLLRELPRGARIVSHDFFFPGWAPEKTAILRSSTARVSQIYAWRLP